MSRDPIIASREICVPCVREALPELRHSSLPHTRPGEERRALQRARGAPSVARSRSGTRSACRPRRARAGWRGLCIGRSTPAGHQRRRRAAAGPSRARRRGAGRRTASSGVDREATPVGAIVTCPCRCGRARAASGERQPSAGAARARAAPDPRRGADSAAPGQTRPAARATQADGREQQQDREKNGTHARGQHCERDRDDSRRACGDRPTETATLRRRG